MITKEYALVTTTCANEGEAETIASALISNKLAACVQMSSVDSRYVWDGEICSDKEVLLTIKCRRGNYVEIEKTILENHSYDLPEILLIPVEGGYDKYLKWIDGFDSRQYESSYFYDTTGMRAEIEYNGMDEFPKRKPDGKQKKPQLKKVGGIIVGVALVLVMSAIVFGWLKPFWQ